MSDRALMLDAGEVAVLATALREGSTHPKDWHEFWREAGADAEKAREAASTFLKLFSAAADEIIRASGKRAGGGR